MGIDYGTKRVGIALTNENGDMAFPREVIANDGGLVGKIGDIVTSERVGKVIVGHSVSKTGKDNPLQERIEEFIGELTLHAGIPIELWPEQYTTQEARRVQGKTEKTDASAAALILNSYLEAHKNASV